MRSVAPPTSPITRAAEPNARREAAGPETRNAPGPSPNRSSSDSSPSTCAPISPARQASGGAGGGAAAGDVVRGTEPAGTDRLADGRVQRLELAEVGGRQRAGDRLAAQLR